MSEIPWLVRATKDLGQAEVPGSGDNPNIMAAFKACGHSEIEHDETAWCAAKVGQWLSESGYPIPPTPTNLMARSYLLYGKRTTPKPGAIAVWGRGKPPQGHVSIVVAVLDGGKVKTIDGNVGDKVSESIRPISQAIDFRWPVQADRKSLGKAGSLDIAAAAALKRAAIAVGTVGTGTAVATPTATEHPAPALPPVEALQQASEQVGYLQTIVSAATDMAEKVGSFLVSHPWLFPVFAGCAAVWIVAHRIELIRIARAIAGAPLSQEV